MIEEKEKKEIAAGDAEKGSGREELFEEYLKPRRLQPKFWRWVFLIFVMLLMAYIYKVKVIDSAIPEDVLKSSIKIFDIDSKWVVGEELDTPDYKGILLVPQLSFRVRNVGETELHYVYFLGAFSLVNEPKELGQGSMMALKKPLKPGEESTERIVLKAPFGYKGTSKRAFSKHKKDWRSASVRVIASSGSSKLVFLQQFYISRRIEGMEIDVKITDGMATQILQDAGLEKKTRKKDTISREKPEKKQKK
jgi:hypothetical protein